MIRTLLLLLLFVTHIQPADPIPRLVIDAVVESPIKTVKVQDALPYRHALSTGVVTVSTVTSYTGKDSPPKRIAIATWSVIDLVSQGATQVVGERLSLTLEPLDLHPELQDIYMARNLPQADAKLAIWVDVGNPKRPDQTSVAQPRPSVPVPAAVFTAALAPATADETAARIAAIAAAKEHTAAIAASHGGSFDAWYTSIERYRSDAITQFSHDKKDWVFLKESLLPSLAQSYDGPPEKGPVQFLTAIHQQLSKRGIDFIVALIPNKEDILPDILSAQAPADFQVAVSGIRMLNELATAGVEVIDLYTVFREARLADKKYLYQRFDTHWDTDGCALAATTIATRLERYGFVKKAQSMPRFWTTQSEQLPSFGDLIGDSPAAMAQRKKFPLQYRAIKSPADDPYQDVADSPIVLFGDSFSRFLIIQGGGLTAQIAYETNLSLSVFGRPGSGGDCLNIMAGKGADWLKRKRVVLWVGIARQFGRNTNPWPVIDLP